MNQEDILNEYNKRKSIRATARALDVSESAVRKVLVSFCIIDTPLIRRIAELRAAGLPSKDIAELLHISSSCVSVNTPYSRGTYLDPSETANAVKLREWRKKKRESGA